jgi:hypothetical protein
MTVFTMAAENVKLILAGYGFCLGVEPRGVCYICLGALGMTPQ